MKKIFLTVFVRQDGTHISDMDLDRKPTPQSGWTEIFTLEEPADDPAAAINKLRENAEKEGKDRGIKSIPHLYG